MIKRIGIFGVILMCFLFLSYVPPIFRSQELPESTQVEKTASLDAVDDELSADYYAEFVGQPIKDVIQVLGEPTDVVDYNESRQAMTFGESQADFLQADIDDYGNVASLFVAGEDIPDGQFKIGMTLADIGNGLTLQDQFEVNFENQVFEIELSGNDLNTKPLVRFDNGSFAMAHLDQMSGRVLGISYYSKEMFLNNLPYRLINDSRLKRPLVIQDSSELRAYQERHLSQLLSVMSERQEQSPAILNQEMSDVADQLLTVLIKKLPEVIKDDAVLTEWQDLRNQVVSQSFLTLDSDAIHRLLELADTSIVNQDDFEVLAVTPTDNLNLLLMGLYGGEFGQQQLFDLSGKSVGIAISEGMLVLVFESNQR
ncbi:hypothetical protein G7081_04280 [Vagococcus coleopterorum]|uniref:CAP-associated domain-containing protein n=1 Tax=Vagococcus coleopterorum TaxID=2714946 RepID=A0A6G8AMW3_9ENTE|nr:CAP-associated domain-containing protein [Vagococcus coleopterorum]QIL46336.1 hypothetical protein G7081_04280 [Vagococcus coleopterorum]